MNTLFYLFAERIARGKPCFPPSHGVPERDDRRIVSGIVHVIKNGLQWKEAPREYEPYKTPDNRFIRWSRLDVFNKIFTELPEQHGPATPFIIATPLKAHRTAASPLEKGLFPAVSDAQKAV